MILASIKRVAISTSIPEINEKLKSGNWVLLEVFYRNNKINFVIAELNQ